MKRCILLAALAGFLPLSMTHAGEIGFLEEFSLAPDRARNKIGSDNDYEYRITGYFSGETVYEPASNGFYPEFIFLGAEVKSTNPPNIYQLEREKDPSARILQPPL